jgi:pimeloyl-ACP methyl ester carboxylesterase
VARLRYDVRGWNGDLRSPVGDARTALARLADRFPDVPVALVGHSMGGRTAVHVADDPGVRAVVGLAPWIEKGEPVETMTGRRLLIVHGDRDRITNPQSSAAYARSAAAVAESASYVTVRGERHAMLRRPAIWHRLTTGFVLGVLFGTPLEGTDDADTANVVTKVLAGEPVLVV